MKRRGIKGMRKEIKRDGGIKGVRRGVTGSLALGGFLSSFWLLGR